MGSRIVKFIVSTGENEQVEALIRMPEENQSIIHGVVQDMSGRVMNDAVVQLLESCDQQDENAYKPLTHTFTDDNGEFVFGPLSAFKQYLIKVWVNHVKIRELIIRPEGLKKAQEQVQKPARAAQKQPHAECSQNYKTKRKDAEEHNGEEDDE